MRFQAKKKKKELMRKRGRKIIKFAYELHTFLLDEKRMTYLGGDYGKRCRKERTRGAIYDMRTTLSALEENVHRRNA
jgi:hypothetical protein